MPALLRDESGQSVVELLISTAVLMVIMAALSNVFTSGLRAGTDANARAGSQGAVRMAVDRLEYEARCSSAATLVSSGAGVALTLPTQCPHATGTVSWCVSGGSLTRFTTADCTGTGVVLAPNITSATPFCIQTTSGQLPEVRFVITANTSADGSASDAVSMDSTIAERNAAVATTTSAACP